MTYLFLVMGLCLLAFGGDTLVSGAVGVARRMGVSSLLIGLTLVGFGTSTPELLTSLVAAIKQSEGIAVGNVVGSNIANILLVLGAAALVMPVRVDLKAFRRDAVFLGISTVGLIVALIMGGINRWMGLILVGLLIGYVIYSYLSDKKAQKGKSEKVDDTVAKTPLWKPLFKALVGIALTMLGAKLLVDSAIVLARDWGVSEAVIGLTIVAVGTSLPELATSVMSALRGHNDVAWGNVVGSNIYNALFILGVVALFMPVVVPSGMSLDVTLMTVVTLVLIGIAFWKKEISRPMGVLFLVAYAAYVGYLFTQGQGYV